MGKTNEEVLAERHKEREAARIKEIRSWKPVVNIGGVALKAGLQQVHLKTFDRLMQNYRLGRNAGHHQQIAFNRANQVVPA